jgi:N-acetylneuraminic acid mutarotase
MNKILLVIVMFLVVGSGFAQEAGSWTQGAPMPTPRSEMVAAALDGKIYVAGGLGKDDAGQNVVLTTVEVYDPESDTWEALTPLPIGLHHLGIAAADGKIYVSGGYDDDFTPDVAELWTYEPEGDEWSQMADMPAPRAAHFMVSIDDKLYVVGGVGDDNRALWAYDPESDTWDTSFAPLSTAREHLTAATVDGKLYVIGGRWSNVGNMAVLEMYDPDTDEWIRLTDMPMASGGLTAAVVDGLIHVTGGENFSPLTTFDTHMVYDPETDEWTLAEPMPTARHGLASAAVEDKWYVIGGGEEAAGRTFDTLSDKVEIFTAEGE